MEDKYEKLGKLIDHLDNLTYSLKMPLPAEMHVSCINNSLPEIVTQLKELFVEITGENPW